MRGASFTASNLGGLGTTHFSPIVNWPEVAILGVGRAEHQGVLVDGRLEPRLLLPLSLSYDHRLIDGADAARFLRRLAEALEQPLLLLLEQDVPFKPVFYAGYSGGAPTDDGLVFSGLCFALLVDWRRRSV